MAGCLAAFSVIFGGTCGAPRVIAPWRGEREWVPVSNPALCRVVGMREDGRMLRLFRGPRNIRFRLDARCPLARPFGGSPPTSAGALPPEFIFGSRRSSLFMAVSQLSVCMCLMLGLACIVLYCLHSCAAYVLCVFIIEGFWGAPTGQTTRTPTRREKRHITVAFDRCFGEGPTR